VIQIGFTTSNNFPRFFLIFYLFFSCGKLISGLFLNRENLLCGACLSHSLQPLPCGVHLSGVFSHLVAMSGTKLCPASILEPQAACATPDSTIPAPPQTPPHQLPVGPVVVSFSPRFSHAMPSPGAASALHSTVSQSRASFTTRHASSL
jgi:hypothetical protein